MRDSIAARSFSCASLSSLSSRLCATCFSFAFSFTAFSLASNVSRMVRSSSTITSSKLSPAGRWTRSSSRLVDSCRALSESISPWRRSLSAWRCLRVLLSSSSAVDSSSWVVSCSMRVCRKICVFFPDTFSCVSSASRRCTCLRSSASSAPLPSRAASALPSCASRALLSPASDASRCSRVASRSRTRAASSCSRAAALAASLSSAAAARAAVSSSTLARS
mmetsp:Transcript_26145/g.70697  ORF Transcript_26145/g.70697 Transcript_26145/m.70697 type:complete len:221 (-) Transcript_26145:297-959(-)